MQVRGSLLPWGVWPNYYFDWSKQDDLGTMDCGLIMKVYTLPSTCTCKWTNDYLLYTLSIYMESIKFWDIGTCTCKICVIVTWGGGGGGG